MSLFLHLSSAVVFFALLHVLRRVISERDFLRTLIKTQRSGNKLCVCPLVFVRHFAALFKIELRIQKAAQLPPALVDAQVFLDFYRQYGIQSMLVCCNKDGNCVLTIKTDSPAAEALPAGVLGKLLAVEVRA